MLALLDEEKLLRYIEAPVEPGESKASVYKAVSLIHSNLDDKVLALVQMIHCPYELWKTLEKRFRAFDEATIMCLEPQIYKVELVGTNYSDYLDTLQARISEYEESGRVFPYEKRKSVVLGHLGFN